MKTVVETFLIEETIELIHDNDQLEKWNERVDELQLVGQKKVVTGKKSPVPFMWMNSSLVSTFEVLCPTKTAVELYDKTPIPVEILDLVSLSTKEKYFDRIEIWFNEKSPDPVCIGMKHQEKHKNESDWYKAHTAEKYLIGRWADVKASLDQLVERAKTIFIGQEKIRLNHNIRSAQRELEDLDVTVNGKFGGAMPVTDLGF